jgi:DNA-binding protein HU-beta
VGSFYPYEYWFFEHSLPAREVRHWFPAGTGTDEYCRSTRTFAGTLGTEFQGSETYHGVKAKEQQEEINNMAAALTKTQLVRQMAEKLELPNKQSAAFFDLLAETAVKETKKNGVFVIPGLGRLVKAERKARMGRNPQTGEAIKIRAKTVVKFRVAKAAKDVIAPPKK